MNMLRPPKVSFVISTRNRRDVLLATLAKVVACGLPRHEFEVHVVDNASEDGTAAAVRKRFPRTFVYAMKHNFGSVAKNLALPHALGRYVVFLDDDSYPEPGAIDQMTRKFEADPHLGAAVFRITLPNGEQECSAYPDVFIGCGVAIRRHVLRHVGGLPDEFFMQAEEYDLSLRILDGGWSVKRFDDLHITHLKTPQARMSVRTMRLDTRNNFMLIFRRFPARWMIPYALDWMRRYRWIAQSSDRSAAFWHGLIDGVCRTMFTFKRKPVSSESFEQFAKLRETEGRLREVARRLGLKRVLFVDLGKNIFAYHRAAKLCGLEIVAIADRNLAGKSRRYRGIPLVTDKTGRSLQYDAVIVSNLSPVHARRRRDHWRVWQDRPVIDLFDPTLDLSAAISDGQPESGFLRTVARSA